MKYSHAIQGKKNVFAKNVSLIPNNIFAHRFPLFLQISTTPPIFAKTSGYYLKSFVIRDFDLWFPVFIELPRLFFFSNLHYSTEANWAIHFVLEPVTVLQVQGSKPYEWWAEWSLRASLLWRLEGKFSFWCLLFGTSVSCFSGIWHDHVIRWQEAGKICCNKNALKKKKKDTCFYLSLRRAWLKAGSEVTTGADTEGQRGRQVWLSYRCLNVMLFKRR